jgi:hypothetical protein
MFFNSVVNDVLQRTWEHSAKDTDEYRKNEALRRLEYYHDQQLNYLRARLAKHFADPSKLSPLFINVVRKITNNLARVYIDPPKREIQSGSIQDIEIFQEISASTSLPRKLKVASRYTKLLKTIMLRPVWRNDKMDLDILTPDILDVECGDTPEEILSVKVTNFPDSGKLEDLTFSLWTPEQFQTLNYRGNVIDTQPNPYQVLPFIPCWDRTPTREFFQMGGDDLIAAQDAINERITDLLYVLRLQGFGQGFIIGGGAHRDHRPADTGHRQCRSQHRGRCVAVSLPAHRGAAGSRSHVRRSPRRLLRGHLGFGRHQLRHADRDLAGSSGVPRDGAQQRPEGCRVRLRPDPVVSLRHRRVQLHAGRTGGLYLTGSGRLHLSRSGLSGRTRWDRPRLGSAASAATYRPGRQPSRHLCHSGGQPRRLTTERRLPLPADKGQRRRWGVVRAHRRGWSE